MNAEQPSIRAELAAAVRGVNAEFARLPAELQAGIDLAVDPCEREVDRAIIAGDGDRALAAIAAWRRWQLDRIEAASCR